MRRMLLALALLLPALPALAEDVRPSAGQTVYVPVYSHIWHGNLDAKGKPQMLLLSSMLAVRNTDPDDGFTVTSVRYYDTAGKMLREFVAKPARLGPMASTDFFVEHKDDDGGTGANFVVEWKADKPISPPIIETVNAYFFGPHSLAFTSPGRAIVK
ncbi:DUF3124 domain-containing protein [Magnetospirillum moscoviense]|uniref:DUF3124 domain-containing protein n=1 Tax=Magnetospirillum moscoviense TaxID=1437059 RepID=A0A178MZ02_9PROT|nr:DUF3124 domain-containing protein [Magnetospirillum moscoviense]MBF0323453.1 DUF3124 domain-containing protein [Alphaproteobacteria bacterium]OAN64771.1 hypothetical protein A6A05_18965 [Magnetospirillum moscoviense]